MSASSASRSAGPTPAVKPERIASNFDVSMRHGITATELRDAIYTHPSATEALNEVLGVLT